MEQKREYTCFFISPIGESDSPERKNSDNLLKIFFIALGKFGFKEENIVRADKEMTPGRNTERMVQHIKNDDLCIVDLTGWNPNVMYEWGMREATGKPTVVIAQKGTKSPYDVHDHNVVFYDAQTGDLEVAFKILKDVQQAAQYWVDRGFKYSPGETNNSDANKLYPMEEFRQALKEFVSEEFRQDLKGCFSEALKEDVYQALKKALGPLLQSHLEISAQNMK